jgi:hypothetical protein
VVVEEERVGFDCGKTPEPYAKQYRIGALNSQGIFLNTSLNSSGISMCWLMPKLESGSSEKWEIFKSGFSSQSTTVPSVEPDFADDVEGLDWEVSSVDVDAIDGLWDFEDFSDAESDANSLIAAPEPGLGAFEASEAIPRSRQWDKPGSSLLGA